MYDCPLTWIIGVTVARLAGHCPFWDFPLLLKLPPLFCCSHIHIVRSPTLGHKHTSIGFHVETVCCMKYNLTNAKCWGGICKNSCKRRKHGCYLVVIKCIKAKSPSPSLETSFEQCLVKVSTSLGLGKAACKEYTSALDLIALF